MARPLAPWRQHMQGWIVRGVAAGSRRLPTGGVLALSRFAAATIFVLAGRRRTNAIDNVVRGLGVVRRDARRIIRGAYRSVVLNAFETFALLPRVPRDGEIVIEGAEHLAAARDSGRGVMICTGHFGSWTILGKVIGERVGLPWLISRRARNPILVRERERLAPGKFAGIIWKDDGFGLARVLRDGETVLALLDQHAGRHGLRVDFLGRPTRQYTAAARLALRLDTVLIPAYALREPGRLRYRVVVEPPIAPDRSLPNDEAVRDVTERLSASLERQVRRQPDQWNWFHDRWHRVEAAEANGR